MGELDDHPRETAGEAGCEGGGGDLQTDAVGELAAAVEEGEVEGDAGAECCFCYSQETAEDDQLREGCGDALEGGDQSPGEDAQADVDVWGDDAVEQYHPFESYIGYVEGGQEPGVLGGCQR